jgi:FkbM family methyltransferase
VPLKELLNSDAVLEAIRWGWKYDHVHGYWFKGDVKFEHMRVSIIEVFDYEHYSFTNVENKIVVDVGAYIGDSAIYFALKGAEKVIAIEPHPSAFNEMLENIRLNNLEDRIIPINAGVSRNHGRICIKNVNIVETWSTYHRVDECGNGVPSITLSDVINSYGILRGAVLKMNCEGCEYEALLHASPEDLRRFEEIIIEYHNGYKELKKFLESLGFDVKIKPIKGFHNPLRSKGV